MTDHNVTSSDTAGVVAPPPLIFVAGLAVGLLLQWLRPVGLLPRALAPVRRLIGATLVAAGIGSGIWAFLTMHRVGTHPDPTRPVTALALEGPYRRTRNPIYLGMAAVYLGVSLLRNARWPLLLLPSVMAVIERGVIEREERYLHRRFGAAYDEYRARVPRWF